MYFDKQFEKIKLVVKSSFVFIRVTNFNMLIECFHMRFKL